MKKRFVRLFSLFLTFIFSVGFLTACDVASCIEGLRELGLNYELNEDGKTYAVSAYYHLDNTTGYEVEIPKRHKGKKVTKIKNAAFTGSDGVISVSIPDTVTEIGTWAFSDCTALETVVLPAGLKRIEKETFDNCPKLKNITIPNTVEYIGDHAFRGCGDIGNLVLPESVTTLGIGVFDAGIYGFPYTCDDEGGMMYYGTKAKPYMVAARAYDNREHVTVKDGCEQLQASCFWRSHETLQTVDIPQSVTYIGADAFIWCWELQKVVIPDKVKEIFPDTFERCYKLTEITIGAGLEELPYSAFLKTSNIAKMTFNNPEGWYFESRIKGTDDRTLQLKTETLSDPTTAAAAWNSFYYDDSRIDNYIFTKNPKQEPNRPSV